MKSALYCSSHWNLTPAEALRVDDQRYSSGLFDMLPTTLTGTTAQAGPIRIQRGSAPDRVAAM